MPDVPVSVSVDGAQRLKRLSRDLRGAANGDLRRELRRQIRDAGRPVVADVRAAALRVEVESSKGGHVDPDKSTGLRRAVAGATGLSVTANGIRIRVSSARLGKTHPPKLARYLDASFRYKRWRHPVFGNRDVWVEQTGEPFFFATIRKHTATFRKACLDAMEDVAQKITR
jgi:hypothetical protein